VIDAGPFGAWLTAARASLRGDGHGMDVPCGECRGCCTSSLFVHVGPGEADTLRVIPARLLVRAPGRPRGHTLLGFTGDGSCAMLADRQCSIYQDRPRTCREYDCRMLAAAGVEAGEGKDEINARVRAWEFSYEGDAERHVHAAVRAAAAFVRDHRESFPGGAAPTAPDQIAVRALKVYGVFMGAPRSDAVNAAAIVEANRAFDTGSEDPRPCT
jgi:Fe-S-cluster containining protein